MRVPEVLWVRSEIRGRERRTHGGFQDAKQEEDPSVGAKARGGRAPKDPKIRGASLEGLEDGSRGNRGSSARRKGSALDPPGQPPGVRALYLDELDGQRALAHAAAAHDHQLVGLAGWGVPRSRPPAPGPPPPGPGRRPAAHVATAAAAAWSAEGVWGEPGGAEGRDRGLN